MFPPESGVDADALPEKVSYFKPQKETDGDLLVSQYFVLEPVVL
jgi:hypothetical protein